MNDAAFSTRIAITLTFMAALIVASVIPGRAQPGDSVLVLLVAKTPTVLQKAMHVCLYAVLTLLWVWTLEAIQSKSQRLFVAVAVAVCFGAALEWYQTRIPGRFGTLLDMVFNATGALLGLLVALLMF